MTFVCISISHANTRYNSIDLGIQMPFTVTLIPVPELKFSFIRESFLHKLSIEGLFLDVNNFEDGNGDFERLLFHVGASYNFTRKIKSSSIYMGGNLGFLMSIAASNLFDGSSKDGGYFGGPLIVLQKDFKKLQFSIEDKLLLGYGETKNISDGRSTFKILNSLSITIGIIYKRYSDIRKIEEGTKVEVN